jgi:hypothetical protein
VGGILRRFLAGGRTLILGPNHSRSRRLRPKVDGLEDRRLLNIDKFLVTATPKVLRPPDGRFVPVTVSGSFETSIGSKPKGFFYVTDQYGRIEPRGAVALHTAGAPNLFSFSFTIYLQAKRGSQTMNGRQYDLLVGASDSDVTASKTIFVWVPKDTVAVHPRGPGLAQHAARPHHR